MDWVINRIFDLVFYFRIRGDWAARLFVWQNYRLVERAIATIDFNVSDISFVDIDEFELRSWQNNVMNQCKEALDKASRSYFATHE